MHAAFDGLIWHSQHGWSLWVRLGAGHSPWYVLGLRCHPYSAGSDQVGALCMDDSK